ncbi:MAG: hypothetical protein NZ529_09775 [Cytophagaceae bacterium]|nr:hypothetical protein [Cytophagaceae bacterium]MDW8457075.1 hypothetical protein [Cytophagaceae bacterium]
MKKLTIFIIMIFAVSVSLAQNKKAAAYNNKIIEEQYKVTPYIVKFFKTFEKGTKEELMNQKADLIKRIDKAIAKVSKFKDFEGDGSLRDAALEWFRLYESSLVKEYDHMIELISNRDRSKEDHDKLDELAKKLIKEEELLDAKFQKAQEEFAKRHNLELVEYPVKQIN